MRHAHIVVTSVVGDKLPSASFEGGKVSTIGRNLTGIQFVRFVDIFYAECAEIEVLILEDNVLHPVLRVIYS